MRRKPARVIQPSGCPSSQRRADAKARLESAISLSRTAPDSKAAEEEADGARSLTGGARDAFVAARDELAAAEREEDEARQPLERAEIEVQRLAAEAKALGDMLHPDGAGLWPPLIDAVKVQTGYAAAPAAALGDAPP